MKQLKTDIYMILLALITFNIWYFKDYSFQYGLIIYILIFIYLLLKQKPISYFLVVILFSVISIQNLEFYKTMRMEYILTHVLFTYTILRNVTNKYIVFGNLFFASVLYLLYNILSISWTPVSSYGWHGVLAMILGYEIYYIITNGLFCIKKSDLLSISKIATYLLLTLSLEIFYTYYEGGFEIVLNTKHLGWVNPNLIAVIYVLLLPIALYKYLDKSKFYFLYFLIDLFSMVGLVLTLSRGAIVGAAAAILIFGLLYIRLHFITRYLTIVSIISYIIYKYNKANYYFELIKERFIGNDFLDDSNRFPLYHLAIKMFKEKPWFGHGLKSSRYLISTHLEGRTNIHYHNFLLQIAATLGIVGLIFFFYLVLKWIKVLNKPNDPFVVVSVISIIGALTHQLVDVSFDLFYFGLYFYSIIAIVEIYRHTIKDDPLKMVIIKK